MSTIAIVGAGPGGMSAPLAAHRAGFDVKLYERYPEVKAAGNILNLWPPPQKVLGLIGVDTRDPGAPANATFRRSDGRVRAVVNLPDAVKAEYGGFIGLLRWGLYKRMIDALPDGVLHLGHEVTAVDDRGDRVVLGFAGGAPAEADVVVGADGLQSFVRRSLRGEQPIRRQRLHLVGGYLFLDGPPPKRHRGHARPHDAGQLLGDPPRGPVGLRVVGARGVRSGRAAPRGPARVRVGARPPVRRAAAVYEDRRKPHTKQVTEQAYWTGLMFHRLPRPLRPLRDLIYDRTPLLQRIVGDDTPKHILGQLAEIDAVEGSRPVAAATSG